MKNMIMQPPVITIDGPSGSGKGTICQRLAESLGFHLLDSGALYRITAVAASHLGVNLADEVAIANIAEHLDIEFKQSPEDVLVLWAGNDVSREIRLESTSMSASKVATFTQVREALLARQRAFQQCPGLVADGRDMGTVVFPDAPVKVFLTASAEERAKRRYKQLISRGESANFLALLEDIEKRDLRDSQRATSPLKPAVDAVLVDSTVLSIDQVLSQVLLLTKERLSLR